jgi:type II secretory pathway pseudopilin PulG
MRSRPRPAGFTVVELLAVIGVIVVLMGIAIPTLRTARLASLNTRDLSNIRQLGIAHLSYQVTNADHFVDVGLPHGGYGNEAVSFVEVLSRYTDDIIMKSPLDDSPHWPNELGGQDRGVEPDGGGPLRRTSYGMNNYLSRNYSPTAAIYGPGHAADRLPKVGRPDRTVCFLHMARTGSFAVSDHPHVESWGAGSEPWRLASDNICIWAAEGSESIDGLARSNYSFVDGSTATRHFEDLYESRERNVFDPDALPPDGGG